MNKTLQSELRKLSTASLIELELSLKYVQDTAR